MTDTDHLTADPRVALALDAMGVRYSVDENQDFRVTYELANARSQMGIIRSATYMVFDVETREISSVALTSPGPLQDSVANELLQLNSTYRTGAWEVWRGAGAGCVVAFTAKLPADSSGPQIVSTLLSVLEVADDVERRIGGDDRF